MGARTSYTPGTFSWVDLGTTDADGAKAFYTGLFGWEAVDRPTGQGDGVYTLLRRDGHDVGALYEMSAEQAGSGAPPAWLSYVSVADADAAAMRGAELGATVIDEPVDVGPVGRMAVVADPQGAVFALWQPRERAGAGWVNDVGAWSWNDLVTPAPEAAAEFYAALFGWSTQAMEGAEPSYAVIRHEDRSFGGIMGRPPGVPAGAPAFWTVYFGTESLDDTLAAATAAGGATVMGPVAVPAGRFASVRDPQGAVFSLVEAETYDP